MKVISYNVNGIRASLNKGMLDWLKQANPDVLCLQEIKALETDFDLEQFKNLGYKHIIINSAQKKGYSGVAVFSKLNIDYSDKGIGNDFFDAEGRVIRADIGDVTIVCVYIPSGTSGEERQSLKMQFLDLFHNYINELKKTRPNIIICGDYNICHKPIDINKPEKHETMSGFLPEERAWFDKYIDSGLVDTFREFNQEPEQYTWWSFRANARANNVGWRLDYHIITEDLRSRLKSAEIHQKVMFSDHCPVLVELRMEN
ncbi:exodeoxyribonuclease III [Bacteroidales bacterium OttesenSCG-928-K03]|nr:exodeoxyribonuclease III [Odoribacter sp. OttesenSCG-928-L07]MDL2238754.1 exodeoxyribonuclease III [Bacteroidales bacterium OttesenSCG-928-L14]MDL2242803.1 exodeoxyribonuclease III [Bacteroidales bacterium OttesenSCG-928-K03]